MFALCKSTIAQRTKMYPFVKEGLWGFVDQNGNVVKDAIYNYNLSFRDTMPFYFIGLQRTDNKRAQDLLVFNIYGDTIFYRQKALVKGYLYLREGFSYSYKMKKYDYNYDLEDLKMILRYGKRYQDSVILRDTLKRHTYYNTHYSIDHQYYSLSSPDSNGFYSYKQQDSLKVFYPIDDNLILFNKGGKNPRGRYGFGGMGREKYNTVFERCKNREVEYGQWGYMDFDGNILLLSNASRKEELETIKTRNGRRLFCEIVNDMETRKLCLYSDSGNIIYRCEAWNFTMNKYLINENEFCVLNYSLKDYSSLSIILDSAFNILDTYIRIRSYTPVLITVVSKNNEDVLKYFDTHSGKMKVILRFMESDSSLFFLNSKGVYQCGFSRNDTTISLDKRLIFNSGLNVLNDRRGNYVLRLSFSENYSKFNQLYFNINGDFIDRIDWIGYVNDSLSIVSKDGKIYVSNSYPPFIDLSKTKDSLVLKNSRQIFWYGYKDSVRILNSKNELLRSHFGYRIDPFYNKKYVVIAHDTGWENDYQGYVYNNDGELVYQGEICNGCRVPFRSVNYIKYRKDTILVRNDRYYYSKYIRSDTDFLIFHKTIKDYKKIIYLDTGLNDNDIYTWKYNNHPNQLNVFETYKRYNIVLNDSVVYRYRITKGNEPLMYDLLKKRTGYSSYTSYDSLFQVFRIKRKYYIYLKKSKRIVRLSRMPKGNRMMNYNGMLMIYKDKEFMYMNQEGKVIFASEQYKRNKVKWMKF